MMSDQNYYQEKLLENKEELVSHLQCLDLVSLSKELCKYKIIGKDVRSTFETLDHDQLDNTIETHYLLQFIMEGVRDERSFKAFLKVLYAGSKDTGICKFLENDARNEENPYCQVFQENDIPQIMEILAECTHVWEELGISLGLSKAVIQQCKLSNESNVVRLCNMLHEWIVKCHKTAIPPTIKNLELKLRSPLVNYSNIANKLLHYFSGISENIAPESVNRANASLRIEQEPTDTEVSDGKSTLLEVLVFPDKFISYQWMKDGKNIKHTNLSYSGVNRPILVINIACMTTEGDYSCCVSHNGEKIISQEASIIVSYSSEKKLLRELYLAKKDMPCNAWPPDVTKHFINLALVSKDARNSSDNDYSVRGDADDIIKKKKNIDYDAAFGTFQKRSLLLVEGRPGIGKTTLVHKISRDWAEGKILQKVKLVFHISLRVLSNDTRVQNTQLSDILKYYFHFTDEDVCHILRDMEKCHGDGICFIIDGLDEYQCKSQSDLQELMYKNYLPNAMVIVASRPIATSRLKREANISKRIEILGFKKEEIFQFIEAFPFDDHPDGDIHISTGLKNYLQLHSNILHMCYLPVHSAMICYLYKHAEENSLVTETQVYKNFTEFMVVRKELRSQSQPNESSDHYSLANLNDKDKECFKNICELAFKMTTESKQIASQADIHIALSLKAMESDDPSLGLITIDRTANLIGIDYIYAFLHLTFQEYLAACYLSSCAPSDQNSAIQLHGHVSHMRMVWKFYCGMRNFEEEIDQFKQILTATTGDSLTPSNQLFKIQCTFETQQQLPCDFLLENITTDGVLNLNGITLTTSDITAICYVISFVSHIELDFKNCNLDLDKLEALILGLNKISTIIVGIDLSMNDFGSAGIQLLSHELKSSTFTSLKRLSITFGKINSESAVALIECLKYNEELRELDLSVNHIGAGGAKAIAKCLKQCSNLQVLDIADNAIGTKGAQYIGEALRYWKVRKLNLSVNKIKSDGAEVIAKDFPCNTLETLDISSNDIDGRAIAPLIVSLQCCTKLKELNISDNNLTFKDKSSLNFALSNVTIYDD